MGLTCWLGPLPPAEWAGWAIVHEDPPTVRESRQPRGMVLLKWSTPGAPVGLPAGGRTYSDTGPATGGTIADLRALLALTAAAFGGACSSADGDPSRIWSDTAADGTYVEVPPDPTPPPDPEPEPGAWVPGSRLVLDGSDWYELASAVTLDRPDPSVPLSVAFRARPTLGGSTAAIFGKKPDAQYTPGWRVSILPASDKVNATMADGTLSSSWLSTALFTASFPARSVVMVWTGTQWIGWYSASDGSAASMALSPAHGTPALASAAQAQALRIGLLNGVGYVGQIWDLAAWDGVALGAADAGEYMAGGDLRLMTRPPSHWWPVLPTDGATIADLIGGAPLTRRAGEGDEVVTP